MSAQVPVIRAAAAADAEWLPADESHRGACLCADCGRDLVEQPWARELQPTLASTGGDRYMIARVPP